MLIPIILFSGISRVVAQSPQKIEQELLSSFRQLQYWASYNDAHAKDRIDSIKQTNTFFRTKLLAFTAAERSTFTYDFKELEKEGLIIRTSEDGLFRIYSWDTGLGGPEHYFDAVFQYKANNEVFSRLAHQEIDETGKWYSRIYDLKTDTKTYYIGLYHEMHSTKDMVQGVKLFCIEDKEVNESVRLFKTTKGLANELGFAYNFLTVARRPERPAKLIYYDTEDDQLHLTVVKEDGTVTKQIITYQFTGKYFERIKGR
ncbi:hypothetical protein FAM09_27220 [Niastella caeni]|uniref:Uncharacterized protein n=1 Tax=Niastella caeni TaxID=2569763 RepID=A0A4S8HCC6_9BACT|nr:hypothetical protein [Niastella caeni]THU32487.1 hypothetical protein FAM09_27220 [Niastella caeni]